MSDARAQVIDGSDDAMQGDGAISPGDEDVTMAPPGAGGRAGAGAAAFDAPLQHMLPGVLAQDPLSTLAMRQHFFPEASSALGGGSSTWKGGRGAGSGGWVRLRV